MGIVVADYVTRRLYINRVNMSRTIQYEICTVICYQCQTLQYFFGQVLWFFRMLRNILYPQKYFRSPNSEPHPVVLMIIIRYDFINNFHSG